ncbi:MAG TPA: hypothetical protein VNE39_07225 [Planctomycetota bacterium]|nr:hypothetical protein [Planctomycetota bacterium]
MPDTKLPPARRFPIWEMVATLLALASLWPAYILNLEGPVWRPLCYVMLGVLVVVLVRRLLAFERLKQEADRARRTKAAEGRKGRERLPWEPPGDDA